MGAQAMQHDLHIGDAEAYALGDSLDGGVKGRQVEIVNPATLFAMGMLMRSHSRIKAACGIWHCHAPDSFFIGQHVEVSVDSGAADGRMFAGNEREYFVSGGVARESCQSFIHKFALECIPNGHYSVLLRLARLRISRLGSDAEVAALACYLRKSATCCRNRW